jgi:superoxide dismutase, Fe-Mn family
VTPSPSQNRKRKRKNDMKQPPATTATAVPTGPFTLPTLAYPFAALEPHIDAMTMQIHHDKHHQAYITNLNTALATVPALSKVTSAEGLLRRLNNTPESIRPAVRNHAGGHANHTLFWELMHPSGGGVPNGPIADAIKGTFGSFEQFTMAFNDAGLKRFGSGWVWLIRTPAGKLEITTTANQDSPLSEGNYPILGNDLWEHAYYLKYQNKRADYLRAWWNVVHWETVNRRLREAR